MTERPFRTLGMVVSFVVVLAGAGSAQDMRPAEQAYKNIQVMKGVPANQVIQGMHMIKASLGVDCTFCHVSEQAFDKDDIAMKTVARDGSGWSVKDPEGPAISTVVPRATSARLRFKAVPVIRVATSSDPVSWGGEAMEKTRRLPSASL